MTDRVPHPFDAMELDAVRAILERGSAGPTVDASVALRLIDTIDAERDRR